MAEDTLAESCPLMDCNDLTEAELQPYPDISGNGVLIGFIGTAYLVLLLVIANILVAYDPVKDPFDFKRRQGVEIDEKNWWRPNPIDLRLLRYIRRFKLFSFSEETSARLQIAFDEGHYLFVDIQLVTSLGILISCYILLQCGLDAYHWQIAMYLGWFSAVTHLSGLTVLRRYLNTYVWTKYVRYSLMLSLLVLLIVGLVPTLCFFRQGYEYWNLRGNEKWLPDLEMTGQWQAMVFSVVQLIFGFGTRSVKLFPTLSRTIQTGIRRPLSDRLKKLLLNLSRSRSSNEHHKMLKTKLILKPALAVFFACRITADMFSSTLFEVRQISS
ncbi:hypothetical protein CPLU01_09040 [Colletotrichum plurivorum]|uniref:Uncharacterized protein n=1 Tax=Colletotrichum plurivorum TaxID=2175906 RepID=A0A8H6KAQ4_9PEZI|nr:hypothetical protein CPLU01_09040 [Colletotrichum plurivorum]